MTAYKLIVADLDDTLLNDDLQVSAENIEVINNARKMGIVFTIATGRMFKSTLPIAKRLGISGPIITYQGALVGCVKTGEILAQSSVPLGLAEEVLKEGYRQGFHINVYLNDSLFVDSVTSEGISYTKQAGVDMNPVGNLMRFLREEPTKILYIGDPQTLTDIQLEMQEKYGSALYITKSKPNYLEFLNPEANKGSALKSLAEKMGIDREEILAFGDSYNDIEMLRFAGTGVAMGNSPDQIKNLADHVTQTNNEHGVASYIKRNLVGFI